MIETHKMAADVAAQVSGAHRRTTDTNVQVFVVNESLDQLKRRVTVARQVHDAPRLYALACAELFRRVVFKQVYSEYSVTIY
jgi:hypothetical protein